MGSTIHPNRLWSRPAQSNSGRNWGMHREMTTPHRCRTYPPWLVSKSTGPNWRTSNTTTKSAELCASSFGIHRHFLVVLTVLGLDSFRFGIFSPNFDNSLAMHRHNRIGNYIVHSVQHLDRYVYGTPINLQCQRQLWPLIFSCSNPHFSNISNHLRRWSIADELDCWS